MISNPDYACAAPECESVTVHRQETQQISNVWQRLCRSK